MKTVLLFLKWIYGIGFIFSGIFILINYSFTGGLLWVICGGLLTPPISIRIREKVKFLNKQSSRRIMILASFILGTIFFTFDSVNKDFDHNLQLDKEIPKLTNLVSEGKTDEALVQLKELEGQYTTRSNKASDLIEAIEKSTDIQYAKEVLADLDDSQYEQLKAGKLKSVFFDISFLNDQFLTLVEKFAPNRVEISKEINQQRELKRLEILRAENKEKLKDLFSEYDGSHKGLVEYVTNNLDDPDSFEHNETRFIDNDEFIYVIMSFRANNRFGAKVLSTVTADCDYNGNIIKIKSME